MSKKQVKRKEIESSEKEDVKCKAIQTEAPAMRRKCEQLILDRHREEIGLVSCLYARIRERFPDNKLDLRVVLAGQRLALLVSKGDLHPVTILVYPESTNTWFQVCGSPGKQESLNLSLENAIIKLQDCLCLH